MENFIHSLLSFVAQHPQWAYLIVFLAAFCESLALVGLLVPGTVLMVGTGAVVATGALSLKFTLLIAMAGAVAGDGLSYWLGRHYQQGLKRRAPFSNHPQIIARGEAFFRQHGGKSIILGRFFGPVRPVIPLIAGMMEMPLGRFAVVNILSAIGWGLVYIIPGFVLGSSLSLIGAVSTRLSLLLLLLGTLLWLTFWLCRKTFSWLGRLGPEGERFLLPLLCLTLFLTGWLFLGVLEDVITLDPLVRADHAIYLFLQSLRTPWGDGFFVAVTEMGDGLINVFLMAVVLLVLILYRKARAARFWLLAALGGMALVELFKWTLHRPRPIIIYQGVSSWGFPSGHTTVGVALYGFLAILLARSFSPRWRWLPFAAAIGMSLLIAFSRLYLGAHWLSDVLGGLSLGWAWVTFLGIFYLRRSGAEAPKGMLLTSAGLALLLAGAWHISYQYTQDLSRYQVRRPVQALSADAWLQKDWQQLPVWRTDLAGEIEQPLTLQWVGDPEHLAEQLTEHGWTQVAGFDFKKLLNLLVPDVGIENLPVLPELENGQQERLLMVSNQRLQRLVLRLWPTRFELEETGQPLWVGTIESERPVSVAGLLTIPRGTAGYTEARQALERTISKKVEMKLVKRPGQEIERVAGWDGRVLLAGDHLRARYRPSRSVSSRK